jgi:NADH-quinone oxidoreductase subunit L
MFMKYKVLPAEKESDMKPFQRVIFHKFYVDEFYDAIIRKPLDAISQVFYKFFDKQILDGIVNGTGDVTKWSASQLRNLQTGRIGFYIMAMVVGIITILFFSLIK